MLLPKARAHACAGTCCRQLGSDGEMLTSETCPRCILDRLQKQDAGRGSPEQEGLAAGSAWKRVHQWASLECRCQVCCLAPCLYFTVTRLDVIVETLVSVELTRSHAFQQAACSQRTAGSGHVHESRTSLFGARQRCNRPLLNPQSELRKYC